MTNNTNVTKLLNRLVETKGREDPDVAHKDRAARLWCENATQLTSQRWSYLKVPQVGFDKLQPTSFADLAVFHDVMAPLLKREAVPYRAPTASPE